MAASSLLKLLATFAQLGDHTAPDRRIELEPAACADDQFLAIYMVSATTPGNAWDLSKEFTTVAQVLIYNATVGKTCTVTWTGAGGAQSQVLAGGRLLVISDLAVGTTLKIIHVGAGNDCTCQLLALGS